jgi:hypothetical protein
MLGRLIEDDDKINVIGGIAKEYMPSEVADNTAAALLLDLHGKLILAGYNYASDALNVNVVNPASERTIGPLTQFTAMATAGAGAWVNVKGLSNFTFHILVGGGTTNTNIVVESSMDGVNYAPCKDDILNSTANGILNITSDGNYELVFSNRAYEYIRISIDSIDDGNCTAILTANK